MTKMIFLVKKKNLRQEKKALKSDQNDFFGKKKKILRREKKALKSDQNKCFFCLFWDGKLFFFKFFGMFF